MIAARRAMKAWAARTTAFVPSDHGRLSWPSWRWYSHWRLFSVDPDARARRLCMGYRLVRFLGRTGLALFTIPVSRKSTIVRVMASAAMDSER